eukprot:Gregarina_sp_Pseudo_9__2572@NODE_283_length_3297_cov_40_004911_g265_i0_p4_GENE_NODE_283_length_3297_cov_40_004911_g265_i0NODE_283_length_3297_cov_40_004911_g265_i0_p4_ORF_typecomplete_len242_score40_38zfRanBP/PF00641_18/9_9e12zfRanBP/PF00641_18/1_1e09DUF35_N/PF12172_8/0_01DUF35_N/PF12172_8/1_6e03DUF35_N/PF12172_8/0_46DUF35_N/PF12172_8/2_8e02DZR/PF12773_7/0_27DZR/PF12773_7/0_086Cytochrom_c3_2/PF14537_6/1Cytochrom_c3_2/PF14537_6/26TF_Zn_Ribbon/PF08271_12/20TF_Zn_Ribbon/PF08271_12/5_8e02TF_Zn_Ribbo
MDSTGGGEPVGRDEPAFDSASAAHDASATRVHVAPPAAGNVKRMREGDWQCADCGNVNFAKRTRCNKCGVLRPKAITPEVAAGPEAAAEGRNAGLFKKGDWTCTSCGNVNWARRDRCNLCIALKPSLQKDADAKRTGKGGGHFDLQDPTDRLDYDSDDEEFDEFGRKKKRKSRPLKQPHQYEAQPAAVAAESVKLVFPPAPISESGSDDDTALNRGARRGKSPPAWRYKKSQSHHNASPNR